MNQLFRRCQWFVKSFRKSKLMINKYLKVLVLVFAFYRLFMLR